MTLRRTRLAARIVAAVLMMPMLSHVHAAVPLALAVVGDSDSHAYHDRVYFRAGKAQRGGRHHATTLQWTEVLHRLRSSQIDQGEWGRHGSRGYIARAEDWLGIATRTPPKEDFRYNFAVSGASCDDLMEGQRQVPHLLQLMDESPARWRNGVVLIRIGVNSFGQREKLDRLAADPRDPAVLAQVDACIAGVRAGVAAIHARHPQARIVLVGIFDNAHIAHNFDLWRSPRQLANLQPALDRYDDALRAMAAKDARIAFFDDRQWFANRWGTRDREGKPAYRPVSIAGKFRVTNTAGDAPVNAILADGHAGTAWNALWAQSLVVLLNARFGLELTPIGETEILPLVRAGLHPVEPGRDATPDESSRRRAPSTGS
ncbi:SGNH/GDSL hydrolase family protein [Pseudoxanthomonas putridarboris]|uniref:GDSL-type esterase/lipase family protein n=1 Tax=Pseudoxanthomonas putridarboris TaxID=752605 RepID=A0ABU9J4L8_9GAMM